MEKKITVAFVVLLLTITYAYSEQLETIDKNNDGKIDNWIYEDENGTRVKWVRDSNYDGNQDQWSFFKDGEAFIDEKDIDFDGKVDFFIINLFDNEKQKVRSLSFTLGDKDKNIFVPVEDTGWEDMQSSPAPKRPQGAPRGVKEQFK